MSRTNLNVSVDPVTGLTWWWHWGSLRLLQFILDISVLMAMHPQLRKTLHKNKIVNLLVVLQDTTKLSRFHL